MSIRPGFEGLVRMGTWLPVEIEVSNRGPDISGQLELQVEGGAERTTFSTPPVVNSRPALLPRFSNKRFQFQVYVPSIANQVSARLVANGNVLVQREVPLETVPSGELLCGVLSRNTSALDFLPTIGLKARQRGARLAHLDWAEFPAHAQTLSSLDCMVLSNPSTSSTSEQQKSAIASWVANGGLLVVTGGANWQKTAASLPAELLPVKLTGTATVASLPSLAAFGEREITDPGPWLASDGEVRDGTVVIAEGTLPILVAARRGAGAVFYLALDPSAEPLRSWGGSENFWRFVLSNAPAAASSPSVATRQYSGWGRAPRQALGDFSRAKVPDGADFGLLLLGYLVVLGPVSYLVLRRTRRLDLSALVAVLLIAMTSATSFGLADANRNPDVVLNRITLIRSWTQGLPAHAHSYVGLFSSKDSRYEISAPQGALVHSLFFPFPRAIGQDEAAWALDVAQGEATTIHNYDLPAGSTGSFAADSLLKAIPVTADIVVNGRHFKGTVTNRSEYTIGDATAIVGREVVRLGSLGPHKSREIEFNLTEEAPVGYLDVSGVLRDLFDAAGGAETGERTAREIVDAALGASYSYYARVDLSAVTLLGWLEEDALPLEVHGAKAMTLHRTLLMATLPVRFARGEQARIPGELIERRPMSVVAGAKLQASFFTMAVGDSTATEYSLPVEQGQFDVDYLAVAVEGRVDDRNDEFAAQALGTVDVFDWRSADWVELNLAFGENALPNPQRFISPLGSVRVRYTFRPVPELNLNRFEVSRFDLVVGGRGR